MTLAICLYATSAAQAQLAQAQPLAQQRSHNIAMPTELQKANMEQSVALANSAATSFHAGRFALAENEARQSLTLYDYGAAQETLAAALDAQGKQVEALKQYQTVVEHYDIQPRSILPYSLLLLKSGQWAKAVTVYNQALPMLGQEELERDSDHFSPDVPNPTALAVAIHLERGRIYSTNCDWAGETQNTEAMVEYGKALQLAPNYGLANYYYGQGWQKLSPAERKQFGTAQQAKAALQKAVKLGTGHVKLAAAKALKSFS